MTYVYFNAWWGNHIVGLRDDLVTVHSPVDHFRDEVEAARDAR